MLLKLLWQNLFLPVIVPQLLCNKMNQFKLCSCRANACWEKLLTRYMNIQLSLQRDCFEKKCDYSYLKRNVSTLANTRPTQRPELSFTWKLVLSYCHLAIYGHNHCQLRCSGTWLFIYTQLSGRLGIFLLFLNPMPSTHGALPECHSHQVSQGHLGNISHSKLSLWKLRQILSSAEFELLLEPH